MNRVVITGYGVTSPIGNDAETFLESLKQGKNGIGPITKFDASETGITVAAEVKDFPFDKYFVKKNFFSLVHKYMLSKQKWEFLVTITKEKIKI